MPTAPAQRCANVANENKWTYDENRVLLGAIEQFSNGKIIWDGKTLFRKTHKYFPAAARARAVELLRAVGQPLLAQLQPRGAGDVRRVDDDRDAARGHARLPACRHMVTRDYAAATAPELGARGKGREGGVWGADCGAIG